MSTPPVRVLLLEDSVGILEAWAVGFQTRHGFDLGGLSPEAVPEAASQGLVVLRKGANEIHITSRVDIAGQAVAVNAYHTCFLDGTLLDGSSDFLAKDLLDHPDGPRVVAISEALGGQIKRWKTMLGPDVEVLKQAGRLVGGPKSFFFAEKLLTDPMGLVSPDATAKMEKEARKAALFTVPSLQDVPPVEEECRAANILLVSADDKLNGQWLYLLQKRGRQSVGALTQEAHKGLVTLYKGQDFFQLTALQACATEALAAYAYHTCFFATDRIGGEADEQLRQLLTAEEGPRIVLIGSKAIEAVQNLAQSGQTTPQTLLAKGRLFGNKTGNCMDKAIQRALPPFWRIG